jgi:hypothetical protein
MEEEKKECLKLLEEVLDLFEKFFLIVVVRLIFIMSFLVIVVFFFD